MPNLAGGGEGGTVEKFPPGKYFLNRIQTHPSGKESPFQSVWMEGPFLACDPGRILRPFLSLKVSAKRKASLYSTSPFSWISGDLLIASVSSQVTGSSLGTVLGPAAGAGSPRPKTIPHRTHSAQAPRSSPPVPNGHRQFNPERRGYLKADKPRAK